MFDLVAVSSASMAALVVVQELTVTCIAVLSLSEVCAGSHPEAAVAEGESSTSPVEMITVASSDALLEMIGEASDPLLEIRVEPGLSSCSLEALTWLLPIERLLLFPCSLSLPRGAGTGALGGGHEDVRDMTYLQGV